MSALQVTWYFLVGLLLTVYAVLDGFDLGVGFWHLFADKKAERPVLLSSIGPVWDGNEVWLLTGGGAIFAAFPPVYATVFSGFYLAIMFLLLALILRAVAIEFRSKVESERWRGMWDMAFGLGSSLSALLFGVALGNLLRGIPLDRQGNFNGDFLSLLNPYAVLVGLVGLAMLATHGAAYIRLKSDGELEAKARHWGTYAWIAYMVLFIVASVATIVGQPKLMTNYWNMPLLWAVPGIALCSMVSIGVLNLKGRPGLAFVASSLSIALLMATVSAAMFPDLVPALDQSGASLTLANSSSSALTLKNMLILAIIGMPFVVFYTVWVHRAFAGKATANGYAQSQSGE